MLKLTPKEQKLLMLLAFLLILGVVLRFTLPQDGDIAMRNGAAENPAVVGLAGETGDVVGLTAVEAAGADEKTEKMIVIHMAGAVTRPGVYHLPEGSRIYELLEEAGGALDDGDLERINLAQPLVDGQQVFLPLKGEEGYAQTLSSGVTSARVNINAASKEQLESLPGIGAVKAQNIINYRQQNGPFQSIDNLLEVSGIGDKTLEGIREFITVW